MRGSTSISGSARSSISVTGSRAVTASSRAAAVRPPTTGAVPETSAERGVDRARVGGGLATGVQCGGQDVHVHGGAVDHGGVVAEHLRVDVDADLGDGGRVVERLDEMAYVADAAPGDRNVLPHVAPDAVRGVLRAIDMGAGAGDVVGRGLDVTGAQGVGAPLEVRLRRVALALHVAERQREDHQANEEQEPQRDGVRDPAPPGMRAASPLSHRWRPAAS